MKAIIQIQFGLLFVVGLLSLSTMFFALEYFKSHEMWENAVLIYNECIQQLLPLRLK